MSWRGNQEQLWGGLWGSQQGPADGLGPTSASLGWECSCQGSSRWMTGKFPEQFLTQLGAQVTLLLQISNCQHEVTDPVCQQVGNDQPFFVILH